MELGKFSQKDLDSNLSYLGNKYLVSTYLLKLLQLKSRVLGTLLSFGMLLSLSIQPSIVHWRKDPYDDLTLTHSPLNPSLLDKVTFPVIIDSDPNSKYLQSPI